MRDNWNQDKLVSATSATTGLRSRARREQLQNLGVLAASDIKGLTQATCGLSHGRVMCALPFPATWSNSSTWGYACLSIPPVYYQNFKVHSMLLAQAMPLQDTQ